MQTAHSALDRVIAALTYDEIEQRRTSWGPTLRNEEVPLLDRSIAQDLMQIEAQLGGRGKTLLSAIAESINEALLAAQEARDVLGAPSGSNVKPAPSMLDKMVSIPLKGKLVDRTPGPEDTPEENPLHEPAPETFPSPDEGETPENDVPLSHSVEKARRSDVQYRQAKDRDSRELERPVDEVIANTEAERLDLIRKAARKMRGQQAADDTAPNDRPNRAPGRRKLVLRASEVRAASLQPRREFKNLPPMPFEQRRAQLEASTAFLKRLGILVSVADRDHPIRMYRITGVPQAVLLEGVVEFAVRKGLQL